MAAGVRTLTGTEGERYRFDPGSFCLELLLTGGPGWLGRYEILHSPDDLASWLVDSRLTATAPLTVDALRIRPGELRQVKQFRDTLWSAVRAVTHGQQPAADDLERLNAAAGPPPRPRIEPATGELAWAGPVTGGQVLGAAAREAIELLGGRLAGRVRECSASDCYLVFLDTSRPGNRRWCSMERCGNRDKVRGYRRRRTAT